MAGEERLRLIAEFRDNASAGVRRLGRELGEVRETPGMNAAARWMQGFTLNAKAVQQAGAGVGSVMGSLGLGGVAAAGGIAAIVGAMKALGDRTTDLAAVSRETGIAATQLRVLQNAAKDLHVDPEQITRGMQYLTGQLALARRGYGELFGLLNQVEPEFMRKIMAEDPAKAMDDVLARLARIPDDYVKAGHSLADGIAAQKQWSQALLGDQGLGRLVEQGPKALADAMADAAKHTAPITKDMIASAEALHKSIDAFNESLDALEAKAGPALFKGLEQGVKDFTAAFEQVEKAAEWIVKAKDHPAEAAKDLGGMAVDAAKEKAGEIAGRWSDPHFDEKREGKGLFAPAQDEADRAARLAAMQGELDAVKARVAADKNPVSFATREADNLARMRDLRDAIEALRSGAADVVRKGPVAQPQGADGFDNPLLHRSAYRDDEDRPARGGLSGGLGPNLVMLWRDIFASGTKAGFLAAFHELQGEKPVEGGGSGGLMNANYGGGLGGGGAGSSRYRAAGGRNFGDSAGDVKGFAPGSGGGAPGKQTLLARESYEFWRSKGLDHAHALGMMVQEQAENNFSNTPGDFDKKTGKYTAFSSFQFRGDRIDKIKAGTGIDVTDPNLSHADGLRAAYYDATKGGRAGFLDHYQRNAHGLHGSSDYATQFYEGPKDLLGAQKTRRDYVDQWQKKGLPGLDPKYADGGMPSVPMGGGDPNGIKAVDLGNGQTSLTTRSGHSFRVGSQFAENFRGFIADFEAAGGNIRSIGGYRNTNIAGTGILSFHAQNGGRAIDVNQSARNVISSGLPGGTAQEEALAHKWGLRAGSEFHSGGPDRGHYEVNDPARAAAALAARHAVVAQAARDHGEALRKVEAEEKAEEFRHFNGPENPFLNMRKQMEDHAVRTAKGTAKRVLRWFKAGSKADDPSDTPISTYDMRDPKFAPPGWKPDAPSPRKNLLDEAHKAGMGGAVKVEHSGGAVVEIRGLPNSKGVKTKTEGMISAVNLRRGSPATAIG